MATESQITELRQRTNEPESGSEWSDTELAVIIDATATLNAAAAKVWYLKAAKYASMVDVSESGSSRKLGDLYKNAIAMAAYYDGLDEVAAGEVVTNPIIHRMRRTVA